MSYSGSYLQGPIQVTTPSSTFYLSTKVCDMHSCLRKAALAACIVTYCTSFCVALAICKPCRKYCRSSGQKPKGLINPKLCSEQTPWQRILHQSTDEDFIVIKNFTESLVVNDMLQLFNKVRAEHKQSSPYRLKMSTKGRK